jgi:predicted nucleic acid-binding protein
MIYLDASYIMKCYLREVGTSEVMALVQGSVGCSSAVHARTEVWSAIHRRIRDKSISLSAARNVWRQFESDEVSGVWHWLSLNQNVIKRACEAFERLAPQVSLRAADALHLACAVENRFSDVYSGDRILLGAASHFGLNGVTVY